MEPESVLEPLHRLVDEAARAPGPSDGAPAQPASTPRAAAPAADPPGTFYTYVDGQGVSHIVDSPLRIPAHHQHTAKRWVTQQGTDQAPSIEIPRELSQLARQVTGPLPPNASPVTVHGPSVLLGVAAAAGLFLLSTLMRRRTSWLMRLVAGMVVAALGGAAYLGWVRRQAGVSGAALGSPAAMMQDAKRAAHQLESRNAEQRDMLDKIHEGPKAR